MTKYYIEETEFTPEILLDADARHFSLKGVSRPEDVLKFYLPAINWVKDFEQELTIHPNLKYQINVIKVDFHLSYFNSASSKMLLQILENIKKFQSKGIDINVNWYYDEADEQMYDDGLDLSESIDIPFNFVKEK